MSESYEKIYKRPALYWGPSPSPLVERFAGLAPEGRALDLGMGEGQNALFLAQQGFTVTGVEATSAGVRKCRTLARQNALDLKAVHQDARSFKIARGRYALITCINLLQFMSKADARKVIHNIMHGLRGGGLFLCTTFTIDDPSYQVLRQRAKEVRPGEFLDCAGETRSLYLYGELLQFCAELRPIHYGEYDCFDTKHGQPHWHGIAEFVGKKQPR